MQTDTNKHNCTNCKYYVEHYVIISSAQLMPIGGHCINKSAHTRSFKTVDNCNAWECNESILSARQNTMKELLRNIETRLQQIQLILKIDR